MLWRLGKEIYTGITQVGKNFDTIKLHWHWIIRWSNARLVLDGKMQAWVDAEDGFVM